MIKKITFILIFLILGINLAFCETQDAYVQYNGFPYKFQKGDEVNFLKNADKNMEMFEKAQSNKEKILYLQESMRYYFLLSMINPHSVEAQTGLGKIYDEMKQDTLAKKHFFTAINLDKKNPKANLYFANFYYKRSDLIPAGYYYNMSYKHGYSNNYYLNYRLGNVYEKLADLETARIFYVNASRLKLSNQELLNKIRLLDELNYSSSQYYLFSGQVKGRKGINEQN